MDIGVKFCGGCNPRYDRGVELKKLKDSMTDVTWLGADHKVVCDYWLAICGCARECVDIKEFIAKEEVLVLENPIDFVKAKEKIEEKSKIVKKGIQRKELSVGQEATMEYEITAETIEKFAALTGDFNQMHTDAEFSANQWFQKPVMHGMFLASLLSSVMGMKLPGDGTILMEDQTKFQKPVFVGDKIKAQITLESVEEAKIYYIGSFCGICTNQNGEIVTEMMAKQMMMKNLFKVKQEK